MVAIGAASADEFDFYAAACQWTATKLQAELDAAAWLPAAASAQALCGPPPPDAAEVVDAAKAADAAARASVDAVVRSELQPPEAGRRTAAALAPPPPLPPHELYFSLIEGVGGEYARQARATRSAAEVDTWLQRSATRAASVWRQLAERVVQCRDSGFASAQRSSNGWQAGAGTSRIGGFGGIRGASGGTGGGDGGDGGGGDGGDGDALTMEGAALLVHSALYDLDNLTDVWESLESLAEQANYIWFTQELDARAAAGRGRRDGKRDGKRGGSAGSRRARRKADERDGGTPVAPPLVAGAEPGEYSIEKGLLSLNLLLFEILCFSPLARGDATAELTALPHLVRRAGGPASVFTLCTLYAALARRLGVPLQLVRARRPRTSAHAPTRACTHARMHHTSTHTSTQPPCAHTSTHAGRPSQHRRKFLQRLPFFRSASHFFAAPPCSFAAPTCACVRASLHARD